MLLSTDLYETEEYYKWAGLFPYTYGGSVEEVAARDEPEPAPHRNFRPQPRSISFESPPLLNFVENVLRR